MKPDQERVRGLLTDTVTLLCKNGLQYNKELRVQGLLGITLDNDDVFVVHINEVFDELIQGQVAGITSGETNSAIVAADSATPITDGVKSRKGVPQKHGVPRTSSPVLQGSSKRKANLKSMNPLMRVKKEENQSDDDIVIMDGKTEKDGSFIPELSDGDREAMRISYGGAGNEEEPPAKRRAPGHSNNSESFTEDNSASGAPFVTGLVRNLKENTETDALGNTSLDDSQLSSNMGPLQDGQTGFDSNAPGCSTWDNSQEQNAGGSEEQDPGSQDSCTDPTPDDATAAQLQPPVWPATLVSPASFHHSSPTMVFMPNRSWHSNGSRVVGNKVVAPGQRRRILYRRDSKCPDKPYRCQYPDCDKAFYRGPERNRHQKLKHGGVYCGGDYNANHMVDMGDLDDWRALAGVDKTPDDIASELRSTYMKPPVGSQLVAAGDIEDLRLVTAGGDTSLDDGSPPELTPSLSADAQVASATT